VAESAGNPGSNYSCELFLPMIDEEYIASRIGACGLVSPRLFFDGWLLCAVVREYYELRWYVLRSSRYR
jgi:hypothetical protein